MTVDMMAPIGGNVVDQLLEEIEEKEKEALESIKVDKELVDFDLGGLLLVDNNPLDGPKFRANKETYLLKLAKENGQLLFNRLSELEVQRVDGMAVVKLPERSIKLPRSKPIPKAKPPTKWEQYAKEKGIQKKKKEKLVWDDVSKEWKPRYGYKRIDSDKDQWIAEIPDNKDPNTDMFAEKKEEKRERIAKNEFQRLRNIARAHKIKAAGLTAVLPKDGQEKETRNDIISAAAVARVSTASLGKFDKKLKAGLDKVEAVSSMKAAASSGKKQKFESNFEDLSKEKSKYFSVLDKIEKGANKIDVNKAVNNMIAKQQVTSASRKDKKTEGKDRKSKKGKKAGKRVAYHNKSIQKKKQGGGSKFGKGGGGKARGGRKGK